MNMFSINSNRKNKLWNELESRAKSVFTLAATVSCLSVSNAAMANPNTAPVVNSFSVSTLEDNALHVNGNLSANPFTDADGDTMVYIQVVTTTTNGNLYYNGGTLINDGDILSAPLILFYIPNPNFEGSDSFVWNGSDGIEFASANATASIEVIPQNDPPTGISLTVVNIDENLPANSTVGILSANDPDLGDLHTYSFMPGVGDEDNAEFSIVANKLQALSTFNYESKSQYSIRLFVEDSLGQNYEAPYIITVNNINDKPVVTDVQKVTTQGSTLAFASNDFTQAYSDEDANALGSIKISSLPVLGALTLNGNPVNINDVIANADITDLVYTATSNFAGTVSFDWYGNDGTDESDNSAKVEIEVKNTRVIGTPTGLGSNVPTISSSDVSSGTIRPTAGGGYAGYIPGNGTTNGSGATRPGTGGGSFNNGQTQHKTEDPIATIAGVENLVDFMVHNNYPNPFSGSTSISYELPGDYMVTVKVYNELGAEVATLVDGVQNAGLQTLKFTPEGQLSNGQYYYNIIVIDNQGNQLGVKAGVMMHLK